MSVRRAAAVEAPLVPDRLRTVLRAGLERQRRNNEPVCRGCGPKTDAYYEEYRLAVNDKNVDGARKTGVDWRNGAICAICLNPLAGPAGGVDVEDESVEALVENVTVKRCNHIFHTACLKTWIQRDRRDCPTCLTPLAPGVALRLKDVVGTYGNLVPLEGPGGRVNYFEGPRGEGRMVLAEFPGGDVEHYEGPRGEERVVRREFSTGTVLDYEGPTGEERMVRGEFPGGDVEHYEGPRGEERVVRRELSTGDVVYYYEGLTGEERVVRGELRNGEVDYYEGPKGKEHVVRRESPNGGVSYYKGPTGEERIVRIKLLSGDEEYFEGPQGEERTVRIKFSNGDVEYYEGPIGEERLVLEAHSNGTVYYFEGPKGEERLVRTDREGLVGGLVRVMRGELLDNMLPNVEDMDACLRMKRSSSRRS